MVSDLKIKITDLYKIFGPNGGAHVDKVRNGVGKTELLEKHAHVLGLQNINIDIFAGRIQVIMGLSGSGKSTLIRHINRLIEPTTGKIMIDGKDVLSMSDAELLHFRRFDASMVFQKFALLPHRTVLANATYGLSMQGVEAGEAEKRANHWLERVGLGGFEDRFPAQLSGGMQQRVGLARALATDADILLMDEAFSALDPLIRADMQGILLDLQAELHKTIVFITHDLDEALRIGDDIAILRDGNLVQQGSSQEIVLNPADDYVADFTKDINRARVLTLGTLSHNKPENDGLQCQSDLTLEEAMTALAASDKEAIIVVNGDQLLGQVSMRDMVFAASRIKAGEGETVT
jgi:glycine betaine/proline transport system ATP-binding protein